MSSSSVNSLTLCDAPGGKDSAVTEEDDDEVELMFLDSEKDDVENAAVLEDGTNNDNQVLQPSCNIPVSDLIQNTENEVDQEVTIPHLVSEAVEKALTEFENESVCVSSDTPRSSESDRPSVEKKVSKSSCRSENSKSSHSNIPSYPSSNKIFSVSSFCKSAADFLQPDDTTRENKPSESSKEQRKRAAIRTNEDIDFHDDDIKLPGYEKFARSKSLPENKTQDSRGIRKNRPKSGSVDFIKRNKSTLSTKRSRAQSQTINKRPVTATAGKRGSVLNKEDSATTEHRVSFSSSLKNKSTTLNRNKSLTSGEWLVLNESQLASFRKLFSRFDQSQSGGICPEELFSAIREFMPEETIPFEDVKKVHAELDIKQTGEIEFDEFLFAMTNPKNYLKLIHDDDRKKLTKEIKLWEEFQSNRNGRKIGVTNKINQPQAYRENAGNDNNIFFTMLRTATKKDSMREIRRFYVNKIKKLNDHVIHDWSAGQRCVGLSDQDVLRRYDHIKKELNNKKSPFAKEKLYQDSPYAKPLYWGLQELKSAETRRKTLREEKLKQAMKQASISLETSNEDGDAHHQDATKTDQQKVKHIDIQLSDEFAKPKADSSFKKKDIFIKRKSHSGRGLPKQHVRQDVVRAYTAPPTDIKSTSSAGKRDGKKRLAGVRSAPTRRIKISEFVVTPKVVPLPIYPLKDNPWPMDYDNVEEIRKRSADILQEYYNKLKKVSATNSKVIYKKLQVDQISPMLQRHFKRCYLAYSGEYEPFVVSPWIPYPVPSPWMQSAPLGHSCRAKSAWT
ncbi:uncharacterized protein LOC120334581 [Styela clava]